MERSKIQNITRQQRKSMEEISFGSLKPSGGEVESSSTSVMTGMTSSERGSIINSELIRETSKEFQGKGAFANVLLLQVTRSAHQTVQLKATVEFFNCLRSCC